VIRAVGFTPADELVDQLRELHAPVPLDLFYEVRCEGCSFGGWEGEAPQWPCSTAALVFSLHEQNQVQEAARWWEKWNRQMRCRNQRPWRSPLTNVGGAYSLMAESFIADKVFPMVPVNKTSGLYFNYRKGAW
jgi:hypothetical protein